MQKQKKTHLDRCVEILPKLTDAEIAKLQSAVMRELEKRES